jgi:P2-related tail formation protein
MSNIYDVKLLDLLPPNLRGDTDIIAASKAIDPEFYALANSIKNVLTFGDIDNASSEVVDNLARELKTPFYDTNLDLSMRRELVKNALIYNMTKGTPYTVESVITNAFSKSVLQEWFEYGGNPYCFRVVFVPFNTHSAIKAFQHQELKQYTHQEIQDKDQQAELIAKLTKAINTVQNTRSHFEGFIPYGTNASLRSFTHSYLTKYSNETLASGKPL